MEYIDQLLMLDEILGEVVKWLLISFVAIWGLVGLVSLISRRRD